MKEEVEKSIREIEVLEKEVKPYINYLAQFLLDVGCFLFFCMIFGSAKEVKHEFIFLLIYLAIELVFVVCTKKDTEKKLEMRLIFLYIGCILTCYVFYLNGWISKESIGLSYLYLGVVTIICLLSQKGIEKTRQKEIELIEDMAQGQNKMISITCEYQRGNTVTNIVNFCVDSLVGLSGILRIVSYIMIYMIGRTSLFIEELSILDGIMISYYFVFGIYMIIVAIRQIDMKSEKTLVISLLNFVGHIILINVFHIVIQLIANYLGRIINPLMIYIIFTISVSILNRVVVVFRNHRLVISYNIKELEERS